MRELIEELRARHACHTVILYGSRARGDAGPESDYDVLGVREAGEPSRDARPWGGTYLDAFIWPQAKLDKPDETMIYMRGGTVLLERDGIGARFLNQLEEIFRKGPRPLPHDEIQARRVWASKMLARARRGDVEGDYRRVWLIYAMLEEYFAIRGQWYPGPKEALNILRERTPLAFATFEAAVRPDADFSVLETLVRYVHIP